ncbi:hypothetical protein AVHM3334_20620 [Acidovorax sp. SUPP3334]|nr:hypothetical protein AVHM3334_20620 [Acidovorax sp. SUPP3334]
MLEEAGEPPLGLRIARTLQDKESWQGQVRFRRRSGETYPAWLMVSAVREGGKGGAVAHHIDIDIADRKRNEERIQFLAHHDVLTELPNRSLCVQRLRLDLAGPSAGCSSRARRAWTGASAARTWPVAWARWCARTAWTRAGCCAAKA